MKLSILIPSTHDRNEILCELIDHLKYQIDELKCEEEVEIILNVDNSELSIGAKRQQMIYQATGEYLTFIDSDDWVADEYIEEILLAIEDSPDVVSIKGYMTHDGKKRENFIIAKDLPYITITDTKGDNSYLRHSNHLAPIKTEIARKIGYKDLKFAEDYDYSLRLKNSGLLKTEIRIDTTDMYHYRYKKNK